MRQKRMHIFEYMKFALDIEVDLLLIFIVIIFRMCVYSDAMY